MRKKLGAAALLGAGGLLAVTLTVGIDGVREEMRDAIPFLRPTEQCTATVDGRRVTLSPEQAENAALITAISVRRGLPARAASIAPVIELRRNSTLLIPDRPRALTTRGLPSVSKASETTTFVPAVM